MEEGGEKARNRVQIHLAAIVNYSPGCKKESQAKRIDVWMCGERANKHATTRSWTLNLSCVLN